MMLDWTYERAVEKAASLIDTHQNEVHLYGDAEPPWHIAETVEAGCGRRMDIATGVRVKGKDASGLTFVWSFDIEPRSANGSGHYQIETDRIVEVMAKMPQGAREQFSRYLKDCAATVEARGKEYQEIAARQMRDAFALRSAAELANR
jgi:hypothetical protein